MDRRIAIIALLLLLPCLSFAQGGRTYTVAGDSMLPTLRAGDTVSVSDGLDGARLGLIPAEEIIGTVVEINAQDNISVSAR